MYKKLLKLLRRTNWQEYNNRIIRVVADKAEQYRIASAKARAGFANQRMTSMRIQKLDFYWDGGTCEVITDEGQFCIDSRLGTETPNAIYDKYPDDDSAKIVDSDIKKTLIELLREYAKDDKNMYASVVQENIDEWEK